MPISIIGLVIAAASCVVGAIQKSDAAKEQASMNASAEQQQLYNAQQSNQTQLQVGQGHDIAQIYSEIAKGEICANAQASVATRQQEGNVLIVVGVGITVITLGVMVFRKHAT